MSTSFSGEDFAKALVEGSLKEPLVLFGMVKSSEDPKVVLFSLGTSCQQWTSIPIEMVNKVEWLGKISCRDHTHDLVLLFLIDEGSPVIQAFAALLRSYASLLTELSQNQLTSNIAAPRFLAIERIQSSLTPSLRSGGHCFIYVDGQLTFTTFSANAAECQRACSSIYTPPGHTVSCRFIPV